MNHSHYILIIAHPDDESMFFLPTLYNLLNHPSGTASIHILCLTNGNYDTLGPIRESELLVAAAIISNRIKVTIINDEDIQDGPKESWTGEHVGKILRKHIAQEKMKNIVFVTFDEGGVSGHVNHVDTYKGVFEFYSRERRRDDELWTLHSVHNPVTKYIPIIELFKLVVMWLCSFVVTRQRDLVDANRRTFRMFYPALVWKAMKAHHSQFVWYRRLFVVFSRYSYVNDLTIYKSKDVLIDDGRRKVE